MVFVASVLASRVTNASDRCFASLFQSKNLSEFGKTLGSIFLKVRKDFKVFKERFPINFTEQYFSLEGMLTITV